MPKHAVTGTKAKGRGAARARSALLASRLQPHSRARPASRGREGDKHGAETSRAAAERARERDERTPSPSPPRDTDMDSPGGGSPPPRRRNKRVRRLVTSPQSGGTVASGSQSADARARKLATKQGKRPAEPDASDSSSSDSEDSDASGSDREQNRFDLLRALVDGVNQIAQVQQKIYRSLKQGNELLVKVERTQKSMAQAAARAGVCTQPEARHFLKACQEKLRYTTMVKDPFPESREYKEVAVKVSGKSTWAAVCAMLGGPQAQAILKKMNDYMSKTMRYRYALAVRQQMLEMAVFENAWPEGASVRDWQAKLEFDSAADILEEGAWHTGIIAYSSDAIVTLATTAFYTEKEIREKYETVSLDPKVVEVSQMVADGHIRVSAPMLALTATVVYVTLKGMTMGGEGAQGTAAVRCEYDRFLEEVKEAYAVNPPIVLATTEAELGLDADGESEDEAEEAPAAE